MRKANEIKNDGTLVGIKTLEVLLDIRDILAKANKQKRKKKE